eukprot:293072_1
MKNSKSDIIDTERVYCTTAIVKSVGRAVAISLEDATLPGTARNKHMTILYRKNMRWNANEIEGVSRETDRWIREKYGHNKAPVTFTLQPWGPKSCHIAGDLFDLCKHLRSKFAALSRDDQRPPHVALFTGNGRGKGGPKTCRICGASDHLKRHCPQKRNGKKTSDQKSVKHRNKSDNLKDKLKGMISNFDGLKARKQKEIELLNEEQKCLKQLLQADLPPKSLRKEIEKIGKLYQNKCKQLYKHKAHKPRKWKGRKKMDRMIAKAKKERNERKTQRRLAKEERKRVKQLDAYRKDIDGDSTLRVHVDGYNIIGCDSVCRKSMRGRGKGRKQAREYLQVDVEKQLNAQRSQKAEIKAKRAQNKPKTIASDTHTSLSGNGNTEAKQSNIATNRKNLHVTSNFKSQSMDKWMDFEVGDVLDARDRWGQWYEAKIKIHKPIKEDMPKKGLKKEQTKEIDKLKNLEAIFVRYPGWDEKYNEWIFIDPERTFCKCGALCNTDRAKHRIAAHDTQSKFKKSNKQNRVCGGYGGRDGRSTRGREPIRGMSFIYNI